MVEPATPSSGRGERFRILVVDDDPETARIVRGWFSSEPYEILEARDGDEGVRRALRDRPHVILLDLRMPGLDGIEVARLLKTDPASRTVPVLLLTASRSVGDKVAAFTAGVDDYVTKPFDCEEIAARIRAMIRRRELLASLEHTIHDQRTTIEQLEGLLVRDEKTGLFNFREFQRKLREEWLRAERYRTPLSLVMLDLDDFKKVNDEHGHLAGDRVLEEFASLVSAGARATDTAARYGGEEFAIILPHTGGILAARVAERICRAVREHVFLGHDAPARVTVSAGVATYPSCPRIDSPEALVAAADAALYRAKQLGKDRVVEAAEQAHPLER